MAVWTCECGKVMYPRHCPHCGSMVDADTPIEGEHRHPVAEEAVSICIFCAGLSIFTENGLRLPTDEEWEDALAQEDIQRALSALRVMRERGELPPCQT